MFPIADKTAPPAPPPAPPGEPEEGETKNYPINA